MSNSRREMAMYVATVIGIIAALLLFIAWHYLQSGILPIGLCSECH